MKRIFTILSIAAAALLTLSCQKGDGDADYGNEFVYMPQATVSGGIDNYYNVPAGQENTANYYIEDGNVNVLLGVVRSGKSAYNAFSVDVLTDDALSSKAAEDLGATVLPASAYTLPAKADVKDGEAGASFVLAVQQSALEGGKYVLGVKIANPSKYELAKSNTSVVVVIDSDAL